MKHFKNSFDHISVFRSVIGPVMFLMLILQSAFSSASQSFEWEEIKKLAIENNAEIYQASENLYRARLRHRSAASGFLPDFSLGASSGIDSAGRESTALSLSAGYDFALFTGGRAGSELKAGSYRVQAARHSGDAALRRAVYRLRLAFGEVLRAEENLEVARETLHRVGSNYEIVRLRYDAGREDRGALLRSEADFAKEKFNVTSAERKLSQAKTELFSVVGVDNIENFTINGDLQAGDIPDVKGFDGYVAAHPEYLSEVYSQLVSGVGVSQARRGILPSLSLSARAVSSSAETPFDDSGWQASVDMRFPFLSSGRDVHSLRIARSDERAAQRRLKDKKRELYVEIENAWLDLVDAGENLKIVEMYNKATHERGMIAMEKYLNGLISFYEWDSIERDLISARNNLLAARSRLYNASARWERAAGEAAR